MNEANTQFTSILSEEAKWRSRKVRYFSGDWNAIQTILPEFDLVPFAAGQNEPANPFLQTVMRRPLSPTERAMPVGVVSNSYSLAPHKQIANQCRKVLIDSGIKPNELRYEVGLSELGEWMNFRIHLPERFAYIRTWGDKLDLKLECFNSVDGSSRLVILFGWNRLICKNGLVIRETKIEISERHGQGLDLVTISDRIRSAFEAVETDRARMERWQAEEVDIDDVAKWSDNDVTKKWGKKAAARVFHICESGRDIKITNPFAPGAATAKPVMRLDRVPGSPECAKNRYDASQALSFVATRRSNAEERINWQSDIPLLVERLPVSIPARRNEP